MSTTQTEVREQFINFLNAWADTQGVDLTVSDLLVMLGKRGDRCLTLNFPCGTEFAILVDEARPIGLEWLDSRGLHLDTEELDAAQVRDLFAGFITEQLNTLTKRSVFENVQEPLTNLVRWVATIHDLPLTDMVTFPYQGRDWRVQAVLVRDVTEAFLEMTTMAHRMAA